MSKTLADILRSYIPDGDGYNSEYAHNLNAAADALESQQSAPDTEALKAEIVSLTVRLENSDAVISSIQKIITRLNKGEPDEQ